MPRAAHFSEEFYAKLGHGIANEIVAWFNMAARHANILKWMVFLFLGAVLTVVGLG